MVNGPGAETFEESAPGPLASALSTPHVKVLHEMVDPRTEGHRPRVDDVSIGAGPAQIEWGATHTLATSIGERALSVESNRAPLCGVANEDFADFERVD